MIITSVSEDEFAVIVDGRIAGYVWANDDESWTAASRSGESDYFFDAGEAALSLVRSSDSVARDL